MHPRLRIILWKVWYRLWAVVAVVIILLALAFSAVRLLIPLVPGYKHELEQLASDTVQRPVTIEKISTDWKWFKPRIKLLNVEISGIGGEKLAHIEQLILALDLFGSVMQGRPDVDDITLVGSDLKVDRNDKGEVSIQDVVVYTPDQTKKEFSLDIPPVLQGRIIKLADINIDYRDDLLGLHYSVHSIDLALDLKANSAALFLDLGLPEELGERIEFAIQTFGKLESPNDLSGRIFVRGTGLNPSRWGKPQWLAQRYQSGVVDVSLWIDVRQPKQVSLSGQLHAENLILNLPHEQDAMSENWQADELRLDFNARSDKKDIKLDVENLFIKRNGREWSKSRISLGTPRESSLRFLKGRLAISFLRIEDIMPWARAFVPVLNLANNDAVKSISGDIQNLYLAWDLTSDRNQLVLQTDVNGLAIEGGGHVPTISGVSGKIRLRDLQAVVDLNTEALKVDYPYLFRQPLPAIAANGEMQVRRTEQGIRLSARDLRVRNKDIESTSWFDYEINFNDASVQADHYSRFQVFNANSTPVYLPANKMQPKSLEWLDHAFISGGARNGEFTLRGPLKKMPFRNGEGIFRIEFDSSDNVVNIWPPGPYATNVVAHAVFDGPSMTIYGYEAKVLDSNAQDILVKIDDMHYTPLIIKASLYGSAQDALSYIEQTGTRKIFERVIDQVTVAGRQASTLNLIIPLHNSDRLSDKQKHLRLGINTSLYQGEISFEEWKLNFTDIAPTVRITEKSVVAKPFTGRLNSQTVTLSIDTKNHEQKSVITTHLSGDLALGDFFDSVGYPFAQNIDGRSIVDAGLEMEISGPDSEVQHNPVLKVTTDLKGTGINLPQPLFKAENSIEPLSLTSVFNPPQVDSEFRYGERMRGIIRSVHDKGPMRITHADIRLQAGKPVLKKQPGFYVSGHLPELDIDKWREVAWLQESGMGGDVRPVQVELAVDNFSYLNRNVSDILITLKRSLHNWELQLNADVLHGQVLIPIRGFDKRGLSINIDYADYDRINLEHPGEHPKPADIPPFILKAKKLKFNNWDLNDVYMLADRVDNTVKMHSLRIKDPAVGLEGVGEWTVDEDDKHHTKLHLKFNSENVGKGLERFDFGGIIAGGTGTAEFDIGWDAPPSGFDLSILQGSAHIHAENGQVLELDPGGGRILGLLSLQTIPRRLALDFRDLFQEGYAFDVMSGTFTFSDGNAYSSNYYINGPVGRIDIKGRTGLVDQDYDQHVIFRPELSNSLPVIGAILGGSTGGWAMVVMDGMMRMFGGDTDNLAKVQYTVTGPWDNPVITPVKRPKKEGSGSRKKNSGNKRKEDVNQNTTNVTGSIETNSSSQNLDSTADRPEDQVALPDIVNIEESAQNVEHRGTER